MNKHKYACCVDKERKPTEASWCNNSIDKEILGDDKWSQFYSRTDSKKC